jgi:hydroxyethylthiazole kinase-like uncharacterized protein yjeF
MKILTSAEMREVDRLSTERHGVPSLTLMENAGKSIAQLIQSRIPGFARRRIIVLCGKGNNGGDGFVVARHLLKMGAKPRVFLLAEPRELKGDAAANFRRWKKASRELRVIRNAKEWQSSKEEVASADIVVDALLGTGARGPVEGLFDEAIRDINRNRSNQDVVAVDIPSGLLADTGEVPGVAVSADYTVTFTSPKPGLLLAAGPSHVGQLAVRQIGSPEDLVEEQGKGNLRWNESREFARFALPRRPQGHKGEYGHALIVAGSVGKSGAAVLASWGALRAGAGLVTVATPEPVLPIVAAHTPEIMTEPLVATLAGTISARCFEGNFFGELLAGKDALAMGPGLTAQAETQEFVRVVVGMRARVPIILDADGLNAFAGRAQELRDPTDPIAVTPHPGEMARLLGCSNSDVQAHRIETAQKAAADWNAHVILKGHQTVIAAPDGSTWINSTGNPGMATAGTGDVLTGMLAGLTAQYGKANWPQLLAFGVYLHGLAGDIAAAQIGEAPLMASDLIRAIPAAYRQFYSECDRA